MTLIFTFLIFILGMFGGLVGSTQSSAQAAARDIERKSDTNSLHLKLEVFYSDAEYYPTSNALGINALSLFPGIDTEALIDPNGKSIQEGEYIYEATDCLNERCQGYTLTAELEEGLGYVKYSLN